MIVLKTARELELMREAGRISAMALKVAGEHIKPGVSTKDIDTVVHDYIEMCIRDRHGTLNLDYIVFRQANTSLAGDGLLTAPH